jgi:hypothetical protein
MNMPDEIDTTGVIFMNPQMYDDILAWDASVTPYQEFDELIVPTFEIVTNPTISLQEVQSKRFYIVDRNGNEVPLVPETYYGTPLDDSGDFEW